MSREITGNYTTSLGPIGLLAGLVADQFGVGASFLSPAAVGLIATALAWTLMPETRLATVS